MPHVIRHKLLIIVYECKVFGLQSFLVLPPGGDTVQWVEVLSVLPLWATAGRRVEQWSRWSRTSPRTPHLNAWTHPGPLRRDHTGRRSPLSIYSLSLHHEPVISCRLPRGVKRTAEATRNPSINPTTMTQAMTEPNLHQLITRMTPPTTPITAHKARHPVQAEEKGREF